jgi:hypothetical protein
VFLAALAACAFGALTVEQASAATFEEVTGGVSTPMLAIYGNPPAGVPPIGFGLARNFGFGSNLLLQADATVAPRKVISTTIGGLVWTSEVAAFGGTLQSGKTGANNPLSLTLEFVDLQKNSFAGIGPVSWFSDTSDRPSTATICSPVAGTLCKDDPLLAAGAGGVKIEDVSVNLGPGFVMQGTVWGRFVNGTVTEPACISLNMPPAGAGANQTLTVTQTMAGFAAVGVSIAAISGEACLISANNYYYPGKTPEIKIGNN